jgi:hypothetical protein
MKKVLDEMKSEDESIRKKARSLFMRLTKRKCDKGHNYVEMEEGWACKYCKKKL